MPSNPNDLEYRNYHDHLPQVPEKSRNPWLWVLLVALLIIAAAMAYLLFFKDKDSNKDANTSVETQIPGTRAGGSP